MSIVVTPGMLVPLIPGGGGGGGGFVTGTAPIVVTGVGPYNVDFNIVGQSRGDLVYRNATTWTRLPASTAGFLLQTNGPGADPTWVAAPASGVPTSRTLTGNTPIAIDGSYAAQDLTANRTFSFAIAGEVRGDTVFRNATTWTRLPAGTSGNFLQTAGAGADPSWVTVTPALIGAVPTTRTLTGTSPITIAGVNTAVDLSADRVLTFAITSEARGDIVFRNATVWTRLPAGTSGNFLQTAGAGADPSWVAITPASLGAVPTTRTLTGTSPIAISGVYTAQDLSVDRVFSLLVSGESQGDLLYRNATVWTRLPASTSGFVLQTNGAAADPSYVDPNSSSIYKPNVRATSNANVASLSGTTTIDGVALVAGDTVLLTNQTTGNQQGVWQVNAGAWTRPTWFDTSAKVTLGHVITVREGTGMTNSAWQLTNLTAPTLGVTTLSYRGVPTLGVIAAPDATNMLVWRRNTGASLVRLIYSDASGNVFFGDTSAASTSIIGNGDIRLTTTVGASNASSNIGITNTALTFNMNSGISAIDTMQILNTPIIIIGQRENTSAAVPVLVPIRGSQPNAISSDTPASGFEFNVGAGRGTGESTGILTGYDPLGTGTTLQSTKRTALTWVGRYVKFGTGVVSNVTTVAGGNVTVTIINNFIEYTAAPGTGTVTLPAANAVPKGWSITVRDRFGGASVGTPITIQVVGADTISDAGTGTTLLGSVKVDLAFRSRNLESDGATNWLATVEY